MSSRDEIVRDYELLYQMETLEDLLLELEKRTGKIKIIVEHREYEVYDKNLLEVFKDFIEEQIMAMEETLDLNVRRL